MQTITQTISEPISHKSSCVYCGDAAVNHSLFYFTSIFSVWMDNHIIRATRRVPEFLKEFVDFLLEAFFEILLFFKLAYLSDDIEKARTFRSRVIWEEALRRGINMKQLIIFSKPSDHYVAKINGRKEYFNSLPIPQKLLNMSHNWDDKFLLKRELIKNNIPVPAYVQFPIFYPKNLEKIFSKLEKPVIVKPRTGSRGRHTITNIHTLEDFKSAVNVAGEICAHLVAEEHLKGYVCRATFVQGKLMGFYRGGAPVVVGDGMRTVRELIERKDKNRPERVEKIFVNEEIEKYIARSGYNLDQVLPEGKELGLTHRTGRLFGGETKEMLGGLHPSFIPILNRAAQIVDLPVIGFDCIVPDPSMEESLQRWGIIECNTLPFIDLHYYALEGKPRNIAGAIWDIWDKAI